MATWIILLCVLVVVLQEWNFLSKHKEPTASNLLSTLQSDMMLCCQSQQNLKHREGSIFMSRLLAIQTAQELYLLHNCASSPILHSNRQSLINTLFDNAYFFHIFPEIKTICMLTHLYNYIIGRMSTAVEDLGLSYYTHFPPQISTKLFTELL